MKNKIIDILSENIEQMSKEDIAAALEIPKKTDMGDFAFPCFRLAKAFRKAPNMIAEELTAQINEKGYDIFDKVVNVGAYINFFLAKEAFAKEIMKTVDTADFGAGTEGEGKDRLYRLFFSKRSKELPRRTFKNNNHWKLSL